MPHTFWQKPKSYLAAASSVARTPSHTSPRGSTASSPGHGDEGAVVEAEAEAGEGQPKAKSRVAHIRFGFCRSGFRHMHAALARTGGLLGKAQLLREWGACLLLLLVDMLKGCWHRAQVLAVDS